MTRIDRRRSSPTAAERSTASISPAMGPRIARPVYEKIGMALFSSAGPWTRTECWNRANRLDWTA
jgi:hypothetical protein